MFMRALQMREPGREEASGLITKVQLVFPDSSRLTLPVQRRTIPHKMHERQPGRNGTSLGSSRFWRTKAAEMSLPWEPLAIRLRDLTGRVCVIRVPDQGDWQIVAGAAEWRPDFADRAVRIPVDGGDDRQAEVLLARLPNETESPFDAPLGRSLIGEVVEAVLLRQSAEARYHDAAFRERQLDAFAHVLLGVTDIPSLHRLIVEAMARAVGAEIGAIAVPLPGEQALGVTATYGYPSVIVEHVRQSPGEGILGRVFASGQPVVVRDVADVPDHARRRRYRSSSYLAFPINGAEGPLAVVALTDKMDGMPFDDNDLALLTSLSAPAALALVREEFRERSRDLAHLATVDGLTGLFNRRYFETRLEQEIQRQRRQFDGLALLMVDLDNFKELNDSQGHLVGDRVLREVGDILRRAVRIFDLCARYGGEEFVILMPGANAPTALRIAERIRKQVEQHFASGRLGGALAPTVSVGVSAAASTTTRETLIAQADSALFQAKNTGKNVVCLHPSLTTS
jgi:diguanylate cyclase (GGDEF)-like protein